MNKKGFTMVELLVAMAIMGLLIIMAFPTIRAIRANNTETKYEEYGKSVISAAKLYVDSYGEDLFKTNRTNEYVLLKLDKLIKKDLIKDINVSGSSCINGESEVRLFKYGDDYTYCLHLVCKSGDKKVFTSKDEKNSCRKIDDMVTKVTYTYNDGSKTNTFEVNAILGDDSYTVLSPNSMFNVNVDYRTFHHWKEFGTTNIYNANETYRKPVPKNLTFDANTTIWKYRIFFNKGVADAGSMVSYIDCTYGSSCKLPNNGYSKAGYSFGGWSDGSNTYANSEEVREKIGNKIKKDGAQIYLTALWNLNPPSCSINISNSPSINGDWYTSDVNLSLKTTGIVTQKGLSTSANSTNNKTSVTINSDGTFTYYGFVKNAAGTDSCHKQIKMDKSKPTCSLAVTSGDTCAGADGRTWYISDVRIKFVSANDSGSGVNTNSYKIENSSNEYVLNSDGKDKIITGTVKDKAGNVGSCNITISRDTSYPTITRGNGECDNPAGKFWYQYFLYDEPSGFYYRRLQHTYDTSCYRGWGEDLWYVYSGTTWDQSWEAAHVLRGSTCVWVQACDMACHCNETYENWSWYC